MIDADWIHALQTQVATHPAPVLSLYLNVDPARPENARKACAPRARAARAGSASWSFPGACVPRCPTAAPVRRSGRAPPRPHASHRSNRSWRRHWPMSCPRSSRATTCNSRSCAATTRPVSSKPSTDWPGWRAGSPVAEGGGEW